MMYDLKDLLPQKHKLIVEITKRKCFTFLYEDATLKELIELSKEIKKDQDLRKWLFGFLSKKIEKRSKMKLKHFNKLNDGYVIKLTDRILETFTCGFFAKAKAGEKEITPKYPISSLICLILEYTNETIDSLLARSWKQIEFLIGGIIWNLNEKTKEGQKRNQHKMRVWLGNQTMSDEVAKKMVADLEKKLPDIKFTKDKETKL